MRSPVVLGSLAALILLAFGAGLWFLLKPTTQPLSTEPLPTKPSTPRDSGANLLFKTKKGEVVSVLDFTYGHPSLEVEDLGVTYVYVTQNDDTTEQSSEYGIVYGSDGTMALGLFAEPFSESRLKGEAKLKEFLPLPNDILCELPITVGIPDSIESMYTGKDLGLSFCPGAVKL